MQNNGAKRLNKDKHKVAQDIFKYFIVNVGQKTMKQIILGS